MRKVRTFARDAPNQRMMKYRAEEIMTSVHSAKETVKWQLTEEKTPAKNRQSFATNENEHTHDVKGDHIAKGQGMKNHWRKNSKLTGCPNPKQPAGVHATGKPAHRNRRAT